MKKEHVQTYAQGFMNVVVHSPGTRRMNFDLFASVLVRRI
jgi:hypothetical protein